MAKINKVKLKTLEGTRAFYLWELKRKESLTENEQNKYLVALKSIEKIIQEKKNSGEKEINKLGAPSDKHKTIFRRGY